MRYYACKCACELLRHAEFAYTVLLLCIKSVCLWECMHAYVCILASVCVCLHACACVGQLVLAQSRLTALEECPLHTQYSCLQAIKKTR